MSNTLQRQAGRDQSSFPQPFILLRDGAPLSPPSLARQSWRNEGPQQSFQETIPLPGMQ